MVFCNKLIRWLLCISWFFLPACSDESEEAEKLYSFPSLSLGQLVDLKKESENMEGFFITTDLSDWDPSYADRGFYLYACVRFLNDPTLNKKLNKSAIPLLIQVSNQPDKPSAETILLLHPQTKKSGGTHQFLYEEPQHFKLTSTALPVKGEQYMILDSTFNQKGRLTNMSFLKQGVDLKSIKRPINSHPNKEDNDEDDLEEEETEQTNIEDEEIKEKALILKVGAFAKQFSVSCEGWPILNYTHLPEQPSYLKVSYSGDPNQSPNPSAGATPENTKPEGQSQPTTSLNTSGIPKQTLIPEEAPYEPIQTADTARDTG